MSTGIEDAPVWEKSLCVVISDNQVTIFMQKEEPMCIGMLKVQ